MIFDDNFAYKEKSKYTWGTILLNIPLAGAMVCWHPRTENSSVPNDVLYISVLGSILCINETISNSESKDF